MRLVLIIAAVYAALGSEVHAQMLSADHKQLCQIVTSAREEITQGYAAFRREGDRLLREDMMAKLKKKQIAVSVELQKYLQRPLKDIVGVVVKLEPNVKLGHNQSGMYVQVDVKCPSAFIHIDGKEVPVPNLAHFGLRFDTYSQPGIVIMSNFIPVLRSLALGDTVSFSGSVDPRVLPDPLSPLTQFMGNDTYGYSIPIRPFRGDWQLDTKELRRF